MIRCILLRPKFCSTDTIPERRELVLRTEGLDAVRFAKSLEGFGTGKEGRLDFVEGYPNL